jgi:hypothetical protein
MAFVTEIVLFRARPGIAAETAVETVVEVPIGSRQAIAGLDGTIDRCCGIVTGGPCRDTVIDGPGVRLYHFGSRSL